MAAFVVLGGIGVIYKATQPALALSPRLTHTNENSTEMGAPKQENVTFVQAPLAGVTFSIDTKENVTFVQAALEGVTFSIGTRKRSPWSRLRGRE